MTQKQVNSIIINNVQALRLLNIEHFITRFKFKIEPKTLSPIGLFSEMIKRKETFTILVIASYGTELLEYEKPLPRETRQERQLKKGEI